ncbi:MAG: hypothetical protein ABIY55_22095 [Kofleriaceae bacterium]
MKKILFAMLFLATACGVDAPTAATGVEQAVVGGDDAALCGAAMPAMTKWDGKPLPQPHGEAAVFILTDPQDAGRTWAIETDGDQVVAWVELDTHDTGHLIDVLGSDGVPYMPVVKLPRPLPPRVIDAAFFLALAVNDRAALEAAANACSELPTEK